MSPASLSHSQETSHLKTQAWSDTRLSCADSPHSALDWEGSRWVETHFCPHGISLEVHPGDRRAGNTLSARSWLSLACRTASAQTLSCFLKRHHQSSVRTRQGRAYLEIQARLLLQLASHCLSTWGRSSWCGWDTQVRGQHGCF